jgi:hypothetical protein
MRPYVALLLLPVAATLSAEPLITAYSSCAVPSANGPVRASGTSCGVESDYLVGSLATGYAHQYASAGVSYRFTLELNGFTFETFTQASSTPSGSAYSQSTFADAYVTAGPVRPGYVIGPFFSDGSRYGGREIGYVSINGQTLSAFGPTHQFPILLGTVIPVSVYASAQSLSDDGTPSFVDLQTILSLQFFESDGLTPVAISEAPEPGTATLLSFGILALPLLTLCSKCRKR